MLSSIPSHAANFVVQRWALSIRGGGGGGAEDPLAPAVYAYQTTRRLLVLSKGCLRAGKTRRRPRQRQEGGRERLEGIREGRKGGAGL